MLADTEFELTGWVTDTVLELSGWSDGTEPAKFFCCWLDIGHLQLNSSAGIGPWADPVQLARTVDVPEPVSLWIVDVADAGVVVVSGAVVVAVEDVVVESVFDANVDNAAAMVAVVVAVAVVAVGY